MDFNIQNASIKHVNAPIDGTLWRLLQILSCNRAMFIRLDVNVRFNIDIITCEVNVHVRFLWYKYK